MLLFDSGSHKEQKTTDSINAKGELSKPSVFLTCIEYMNCHFNGSKLKNMQIEGKIFLASDLPGESLPTKFELEMKLSDERLIETVKGDPKYTQLSRKDSNKQWGCCVPASTTRTSPVLAIRYRLCSQQRPFCPLRIQTNCIHKEKQSLIQIKLTANPRSASAISNLIIMVKTPLSGDFK